MKHEYLPNSTIKGRPGADLSIMQAMSANAWFGLMVTESKAFYSFQCHT